MVLVCQKFEAGVIVWRKAAVPVHISEPLTLESIEWYLRRT